MTKQEELTGLRELRNHLIAVQEFDDRLSRADASLEEDIRRTVERRMPQPPAKKEISLSYTHSKKRKVLPPLILLASILAIFIAHLIFEGASINTESAWFLFPALAFCSGYYLCEFVNLSIFGWTIFIVIPTGLALIIYQFTSKNLPYSLTLLAIAFIFLVSVTIVDKREKKAQKNKVNNAEQSFQKSFQKRMREYEVLKQRITDSVKSELTADHRARKEAYRKQRAEHQNAVASYTLLHPDYKKIDIVTYLIDRMEHGEADSIKEALQIKRAEDQKAAHDRAQFEWNEFLRRRDEDRKWEEQRAQWARDQAQAERERERREQAERIADELEEIRKKLEKD